MRKYRVVGTVLDPNWGDDKFELELFAETPWEAMDKAADIMNKEVGKGNIDDLNAKDLGPEFVYISSDRDAYEPQRKTLTVGELIKILEDYDEDSPVNIVDFNGFTKVYGYLNNFRIEAQSEVEEEEDY